jgi:hypothetical protein
MKDDLLPVLSKVATTQLALESLRAKDTAQALEMPEVDLDASDAHTLQGGLKGASNNTLRQKERPPVGLARRTHGQPLVIFPSFG